MCWIFKGFTGTACDQTCIRKRNIVNRHQFSGCQLQQTTWLYVVCLFPCVKVPLVMYMCRIWKIHMEKNPMYKIIKICIYEMPFVVLWVRKSYLDLMDILLSLHWSIVLRVYCDTMRSRKMIISLFSSLVRPHLDIVFSSAHHSLKKMLITWSKSREGLSKWWKY